MAFQKIRPSQASVTTLPIVTTFYSTRQQQAFSVHLELGTENMICFSRVSQVPLHLSQLQYSGAVTPTGGVAVTA